MPKRESSKIRLVIIVLAALLTVSLLSLVGIILYRHFGGTTTVSGTAPNNIITPEEKASGLEDSETGSADIVLLSSSGRTSEAATAVPLSATAVPLSATTVPPFAAASGTSTNNADVTISLYARHSEDNMPFQVENMFPGDSETNEYCVRVSHKGNVTLRFRADIRTGYEKLAEVLKCRVVLPDSEKVLYDGLMRDMPESLSVPLSASESKTSEVVYEISASLDTSTGNEYMDKTLIADFRWWVEETGELTPPKTGDDANLIFWCSAGAVSLSLLILLLVKRKKEDAANEK